jgi:hypothetical protein
MGSIVLKRVCALLLSTVPISESYECHERLRKDNAYWVLVFGVVTSGLLQSSNTIGHAFIKLVQGLLQKVVPLILKSFPHLILVTRKGIPGTNKVVQLIPYMFYDVHVGRRWGPREYSDLPILEPVSHDMRSVLWVIVLLENVLVLARFLQISILECAQKTLLKDLNIPRPIHDSLNAVKSSHPLPSDATPHHNISTSMFDCLLRETRVQCLSRLHPTILVPI